MFSTSDLMIFLGKISRCYSHDSEYEYEFYNFNFHEVHTHKKHFTTKRKALTAREVHLTTIVRLSNVDRGDHEQGSIGRNLGIEPMSCTRRQQQQLHATSDFRAACAAASAD